MRQGTNLAVALDPAGASLVVDLLGGLWQLPVTGGGATALIPGGSGIAQPRFDPAGERVVFQRWLDGQWDIWQLTLANGEYAPLTETEFNEREPDYSADGRYVAFASDRTGSYQIWSLELAGGALRQLTDEPGDSRYPTWSANGELAYARRLGTQSSIRRYSGGPAGEALVTSSGVLEAPSWRPGGGVLVFNERDNGVSSDLSFYVEADEPIRRRLTAGEDVFVGRVAWLSAGEYVYAADGQLWRRRIASQERTPLHLIAGTSVDAVPAREVTRPLDAPGPHPVAGINGTVRHAGSDRTAFTALGDLWLIDDGELHRLTDDPWTDAWPGFSPDGEWLVFASDRGGSMQLWRLRIGSGEPLQLTEGPGKAFGPVVSDDGGYVAYLETDGFGPWDEASLRLVEIERPFRPETLASGLYDASDLGWQSSGNLRLLARDASAREPLPRVFATSAPATAAPATAVLPESGRAEPEPPETAALTWQPAAPDAPYVIQAGRVFDGIRGSYTYLVDIHITGQRITDIVRRGRLPLPERVVDASDATVVPGLIDVHAHLSLVAGSAPGRAWLASGITTVRAVMDRPLTAVELAESWASGRQAGPRLVVAPTASAMAVVLPPTSPIVVGAGNVARGLPHGLAEQMARGDRPLAALPPVIAPRTAGDPPALAVSTLGRSYQDVIGQLSASGAWLPTGLAALATTERASGIEALSTTLERIMRSSGRVAIGSDAPAVAYGTGFHEELALLAARGIPNDQILRWATSGGALAIGLSLQLGTIEPGRLADLVIVDGDPLADIGELQRIEGVVRGGVLFDPDGLVGMP